MVGQSLLFFADVQFLNVVNKLLLQTILVVVGLGNGIEPIDDAGTYFFHAALLERLQFGEQTADVIYFLSKLALQGLAFLLAEAHQLVDGLNNRLAGQGPLFVGEHFGFGFRHHVGQTHDDGQRVLWCGNMSLGGYGAHLLVIVLHQCAINGQRVGAGVFFHPDGKIHLAADKFLGNELPDFHFFLAIERGNAC